MSRSPAATSVSRTTTLLSKQTAAETVPSNKPIENLVPAHSNLDFSLPFKVLPRVDQADVYEAVAEALVSGDSIGKSFRETCFQARDPDWVIS